MRTIRRTRRGSSDERWNPTWAVFETNNEPLLAEVRLNIRAFLQNLFVNGNFAGSTAQQACFVRQGFVTSPLRSVKPTSSTVPTSGL